MPLRPDAEGGRNELLGFGFRKLRSGGNEVKKGKESGHSQFCEPQRTASGKLLVRLTEKIYKVHD